MLKLILSILLLTPYTFARPSDTESPTVLKGTNFSTTPGGILVPQNCDSALIASTYSIYNKTELLKKIATSKSTQNEEFVRLSQLGDERLLSLHPNIDDIEAIAKYMPNFAAAAEYYANEAQASRFFGSQFDPRPILLVGPPGIGKTHFARSLSEALHSEMHFISMAGMSANFELSGIAPSFQGAQPGKIAKSLINGKYANPVIIIDEIDKATSGNYNPLAPFHDLLEKESAKNFSDRYYDLNFDASQVIWVITANDINNIPESLQSRMRIFHIQPPNKEESRVIMQSILLLDLKKRNALNKFDPTISEAVFEFLSSLPPREIAGILHEGINRAVKNQRRHLEVSDLTGHKSSTGTKKSSIGFIN